MTVKEFTDILSELPQDDEIVIYGEYDNIMGDQSVNTPEVEQDIVYGRLNKKGYTCWETRVSNYRGDIQKKVWVIR